jgi:predicted Zn-dependent peptidase
VYSKDVLDNGLRVITSAMPQSRSVCLAILVGTGSCYESKEEAGISHFAEHLFFKGTQRRRTSMEITQDIEGLGGIINGGTDKEVTIFWCKVASPHFPIALDVLSDLLLNSRFDEKDIERERQVIIEEINMNMDLPQQRVGMLIDELLWPDQPLGRDVIGYKETVSSITRKQFTDYLARRYMPNNTVISIAGNIQHEQAMSQIKPVFDAWPAGQLSVDYATDDKQTEAKICVESKDIEQAHVCLAAHGFSHSHARRLFMEIREHKGLAYDIHSYTEHFLKSGTFAVYAGVDPGKVDTAVAAILDELSQSKRGITPAELTRAKELSKGRTYLRFEDSQNVALWYGGQEILTRQILDIDDVISIVDAITLDELHEVAGDILPDSGLNLAVTGPVEGKESRPGNLIKEEPLRQLLKI